MDDKIKAFSKELDYIINPKLKEYATKAIANLPDYFFSIGASSSKKYHPSYALGEGGLVRHVRACVRVAVDLFRLDMFNHFSEEEKDAILVCLLLHDGTKRGFPEENHTRADHPLLMVEYLSSNKDLRGILTDEKESLIFEGIARHMGQWQYSYGGEKILPKPENKFHNMIHLVDYICSRKSLEMNFDVEVNRE